MVNINIEGVEITPLRIIGDERGAVLHMLRNDSPGFVQFGECYFSEIFPGIVKAWKTHKKQTQNLTVPVGVISLVIYDDRENSGTRGQLLSLTVGRPDNYIRVKIPSGLWYGFSCISEMPALIVNCPDMPHDPQDSILIDHNSESIPYHWHS